MNKSNAISKFELTQVGQLAIVINSSNGIANKIAPLNLQNNRAKLTTSIPVYNQASHLPPLMAGHEILFIDTPKGAYIIARSLQKDEQPQAELKYRDAETIALTFGQAKIEIKANGKINLSNKNAKIELPANGKIKINGQQITQQSEKNTYIKAKQHIHLN